MNRTLFLKLILNILDFLCNHSVLVDKLFDTITNGATLDFTTGFYKDTIDESALNNQEFVDAHNDGEDGPNTYEWDEGIAP